MAINWSEVEKDSQSTFLKISDGQTVIIEFLSEPEKTKNQFGKTQYSAKVMVDNRVLDWSFSSLLMHQVGEALGKPVSLIKKLVSVSRTGLTRDDTRYVVKGAIAPATVYSIIGLNNVCEKFIDVIRGDVK